ncbi:paraquat-inducible protein A [Pelagicoccus sp. SDUM812005]|uniref:paraquat-inducible protein A n=1 Tax=Pelagicoccus sp. SDUM812005 TaxID=3041257 RepID=UPI00280F2A4B|nr:paraquat-inducible protein A [Pelagicoccus sp. SDUM812005]MDQ8180764.1 paraquat-inducible protein A [Pelagicoccus sp. SDUM812005]
MPSFSNPFSKQLLPACLLCLSLICNVAALAYPFMKLRKGLDNELYTLLHSVSLLWSKGLYVLSLLVVGFSILFPFAKLGILFWIISADGAGPRRQKWLERVERLGKWSMLDVFLVSIILSLASKQFFVGAKPEIGLTLFIAAILVSMGTGELIAARLHRELPPPPAPSGRNGGFLLALSGIALIAALSLPFLRIEDWLLKNREYSILSLVPALWIQGAWVSSALSALFLVAAPILVFGAQCYAWKTRGHPRWINRAQRWSMLDVFGLALVVFAIESDHLMKTEIHWGTVFLGATLLLQTAFSLVLQKANNAPTPASPQRSA